MTKALKSSKKKSKKKSKKTTVTKKGKNLLVRVHGEPSEIVGLDWKAKELAEHLVVQVTNALVSGREDSLAKRVDTGIQAISAIKPDGLLQAMLATQMIAVHDAAIEFIRRSTLADQTIDGVDSNINRAVRLTKVFVEQIETMQKLKGESGRQKVTVEHVHIHQGAQAIVGNVEAGKRNSGEGGR